ncbi:hypothetical protein PENTCL1PPCAC_13648, partial [Pristionchus entomophagus]
CTSTSMASSSRFLQLESGTSCVHWQPPLSRPSSPPARCTRRKFLLGVVESHGSASFQNPLVARPIRSNLANALHISTKSPCILKPVQQGCIRLKFSVVECFARTLVQITRVLL